MTTRNERIRRFRERLRESYRAHKEQERKAPVSHPPRYDDVYEQGAAWLDAIARGDICEECGGEHIDTHGLAEHGCRCMENEDDGQL